MASRCLSTRSRMSQNPSPPLIALNAPATFSRANLSRAPGPSRASISSFVRSVHPSPIGPRSTSRNASNVATSSGGVHSAPRDCATAHGARAEQGTAHRGAPYQSDLRQVVGGDALGGGEGLCLALA
eukprot:CAMPEP_0195625562 /NCGR_PEP_ID=MMETSP0815-20121206/17919_1 /TAXON_ID=97485 /ORGANISM="Prymnesium parvum, Strain Texoma1" /LENGTH=126 /DNA_ID=CAMNT_0040766647 /DNA_START=212 /DNA_END=588 /DNA_ORIENTATION=-